MLATRKPIIGLFGANIYANQPHSCDILFRQTRHLTLIIILYRPLAQQERNEDPSVAAADV